MITTGQLRFRQQFGRNPRISRDPIDMGQLIIEDEDGVRLGYVSTVIDDPPVNLIVRVSDEDAEEIGRQTEAELKKPIRRNADGTMAVCMPPRITERVLRRVSKLLGPDAIPYEVEVTQDVPTDEDQDEDEDEWQTTDS